MKYKITIFDWIIVIVGGILSGISSGLSYFNKRKMQIRIQVLEDK